MKLRIIDCSLLDKQGHHFEYAKSVYDEWTGRGLPVSVYCHKAAQPDILGYFKAKGIFSKSIHDRTAPAPMLGKLNLLANLVAANRTFRRELQEGMPSAGGTEDTCFFHTIDITQLFGLRAWYRSIRPEDRPRLALVFRLGAGDNPETRRYSILLYRIFFRTLFPLAEGRIFCFSDSAGLAEEYGRIAGKRVSVLPIPHLPEMEASGDRPIDGKFRIVYLGDARIEKGYHLLPRVVENILSGRDDVKFLIQSNVSANPPEEIVRAAGKLRAMRGNVECIVELLDTKDYYALLLSADAVLLPYSPAMYRARTSGIFAEAIAFGKPVVVPEATWMERQIAEYGQCGIAMRGYGEEPLEKSIRAMIDDHGEYRRRAEAAAGRWKKFHNAANYVDMLIESIYPGNKGPG